MPPSPAPTTSDGATLGFTSRNVGNPGAISKFTGLDVVYSEPVIQPYTLVLPLSIGALQSHGNHFAPTNRFAGFDAAVTFPPYYETFGKRREKKTARIYPPLYVDLR